MIIKKNISFILACYLLIIALLFIVKAKVNVVNILLKSTESEILKRDKEIKLLSVELEYLSSTERLSNIAKSNDRFKRIDISKMISDPACNEKDDKFLFVNARQDRQKISEIRTKLSNNSNVKWRYKSRKTSSIREASVKKSNSYD